MPKTDPIRPLDDDAREMLRALMADATFAALATSHPDHGTPHVTRIALALTPQGQPLTLISDLSLHTRALRAAPACGLLVGEPGDKGDPLTHPRASLNCTARFITRQDADYPGIRDGYVEARPKSKLYVDFGDFNFAVLNVSSVDLNGGFGKAYQMSGADYAEIMQAQGGAAT